MRSCCEPGSSWNTLIISCSCFCRNAYEYSWKCCKNAAAGRQGMITSLKSYTICIFLTDRRVYEAHHAYQEHCSCMRMLVTPGVLMASQRCCKESIYTLVLIITNVLWLRREDWRREAETSLCCSCWGFSTWVPYPWLLASKYWLPLDWEEKEWHEHRVVHVLPWHCWKEKKKDPVLTTRGVMSAGIRAQIETNAS